MDDLERELEPHIDLENDSDSSEDNSSKGEKKSKFPLVKPIYGGGFMCRERIREAMLHHRWEEAAEYMVYYPQILEDRNLFTAQPSKEFIWRTATEIFHHHPNSTMEDYNTIYERMKHSGFRHYLMVLQLIKISLEHSFHLLLHQQIEDAKRHLASAESWRHGKETAAQIQNIKLIQAYRGLLDYIIWCDKKSTRSNNYYESDSNQTMQNYFRQASVNLEEILKNPGVWDCFILRYVEMLEFYEHHKEALQVLNDYAYDSNFPPNPNAHVYLYQYLKRQGASEKRLMKVLKVKLRMKLTKQSDTQKALGVVLEMLDFNCWGSNLEVWIRLKAVIQKLQNQKDWWLALHFTSFHATKDSKEKPELFEVKASLTKILCPGWFVFILVELILKMMS
uniref:TATA box binding protein (TBP)-associated factor, RNA polymerase I, A n=1 Tax=Neolamprologus brichardi TaxID=32507 RepID=A0A3Q4I4Z2_NEOBR